MIKFFEKYSKLSWAITIFGAIMIFYISSMTFVPGTGTITPNAIVYHLVAFFLLAIFLLMSSLKGKMNYRIFLISFILLILYGILDELHQFFVPGRFCSLFDMSMDSIGILLAFGIYLIRLKFNSN